MPKIIGILLIALFITGCSSALEQQPIQPVLTLSVQPSQTLPPTQNGLSIRSTERVETVIAIQTASTTPFPTYTLTITPTPIPVDLSDLTSIAQVTQEPLFEKYCATSGYRYFFNDQWGVCDLDDNNFIVFGIDGRTWQFSYTKLGMAHIDLGSEYYTRTIYWTQDGTFAYFAPFPRNYDPLSPFYGDGTALLRVNLINGDIQTILPDVNHYYSISFSPTGRRMAYSKLNFENRPLDLVIQDLQSGALNHLEQDQKYSQAGEFIWSSDGLKLAYKLIIDGDECSRKFSIRLLDINAMSSTTIIDDTQVNTCQESDPTFYIDEVTDNSVVLEQHGDVWTYNISTKHLTLQATATPPP